MNLVPEILGWVAFMIAAATVIILVRKNPDWRAQIQARKVMRAAGWLEFTRRQDFQRTLEQQAKAIESAIAVIESDFPDFPADVRDQLLAAHEAAGTPQRRQD